ncbi:unnamed protein product [Dovyalis caffra]|uniref:SMP domain-containing protein n=1 Tax=Dovyalis caffra TaxID=77055 RepID=A0AAV1S8Y1_9ROSI|nr:unnamed protein product [Dovyalis caffra]
MSQQQPRRSHSYPDSMKYGDVFDVHGDIASKPVAPQDAASMQSAENLVLGKIQRGGPAAVMQSAASYNVRAGIVDRDEATDVVRDQGVSITEATIGGSRVVTERIGGEIVAQYVDPRVPETSTDSTLEYTIGEALEAAALSAGEKPVDQGDAAAIQAAEMRATGSSEVRPGGLASQAQSAADVNPRIMSDENKTTLSDVLGDATARLPSDKPATGKDAQLVVGAEIRNQPGTNTTPGGVASSVAAAANIDERLKLIKALRQIERAHRLIKLEKPTRNLSYLAEGSSSLPFQLRVAIASTGPHKRPVAKGKYKIEKD